MTSGSYIDTNKYKKILDLTSIPNFYVLGFGRYSPWTVDLSPPVVSGLETSVDELFGFIRVQEITGVVQTTEDLSDFSVNGQHYKKLTNNLSVLSTAKCREVCFEATLTHSEMTQPSWRSLSLHKSSVALTQTGFLSTTLQNLSLVYLAHFSPRTKESGAIETVRFILPIDGGL
jgi:hypothetical protein